MKLLLTAFEPFGGEMQNAALEAVSRLPARIGAVALLRLTLPVSFSGCCAPVLAAIERERPDAILCVGQAGDRAALTPELRAVNRMDARIPDNDGAQPRGLPIVPGGPEAYDSTLPAERMLRSMLDAGVPAALSDDAGRFVCNRLLYGVLHCLSERRVEIPAGFLHVPRFTGQSDNALLSNPSAARSDNVLLPHPFTGQIDNTKCPVSLHEAEHCAPAKREGLPLQQICTGLRAAIAAIFPQQIEK